MKYSRVLRCLLLAVAAFQVIEADTQDDSWNDSFDDPAPVGGTGNVKEAQIGIHSSEGKVHGSNYAGFNQACSLDSEPGVRCNPNLNLICDMRICKCRNSTIEPDLVYTYSPVAAKCVPVARVVDNWACEHDVQCKSSRLGRHSRCNYRINSCECADADGQNRDIVRVNDTCYVKKEIGSQCTNDFECTATIKGNAVCLGLRQVAFGTCSCAGGYSFDPLLAECLEIGTNEESTCKSDRQCDDSQALGSLARCNPTTGKCQCWDTKNNEEVTAFYRLTKKCYYKRAENKKCDYREECSLGFHRKADCVVHPAFNDDKVCQCPAGESCSGAHATTTFSILLLIVAAFLVKSF